MSSVGVKIDQFDLPVCNSFQAKILNDQVCYEIDLKKFSKGNNNNAVVSGFNFIMDYNEDRQVTFDLGASKRKMKGLVGVAEIKSYHDQQAFIYLDTIGKGV